MYHDVEWPRGSNFRGEEDEAWKLLRQLRELAAQYAPAVDSLYRDDPDDTAPVMRNYEAKKPSYFATPSPQLIHALHTSLTQITCVPMEQRFAKHYEVSRYVKNQLAEMGLQQLASEEKCQANGMTAVYLPEGVTAPELLPELLAKGIVFAGGLHREIAAKYFRFGHMGVSVTQGELGHIEKALEALKECLAGYKK